MSGEALYGAVPFAVAVEHSGDRLVVTAQGELDLATAPVVERALIRALEDMDAAGSVELVELDLSELDFIDLAGLRAIHLCSELTQAHGLRFALGELAPQAKRLLELCEALRRE